MAAFQPTSRFAGAHLQNQQQERAARQAWMAQRTPSPTGWATTQPVAGAQPVPMSGNQNPGGPVATTMPVAGMQPVSVNGNAQSYGESTTGQVMQPTNPGTAAPQTPWQPITSGENPWQSPLMARLQGQQGSLMGQLNQQAQTPPAAQTALPVAQATQAAKPMTAMPAPTPMQAPAAAANMQMAPAATKPMPIAGPSAPNAAGQVVQPTLRTGIVNSGTAAR